jgi:apolipoprotein N-acyltransferase
MNLLLAVISGVLLGLSFPPLPTAVFAYIGFVPLLILFSRLDGMLRTLRYSYVTFFVFNMVSLYWVGGFTHGRDPYLMAAGAGLMVFHPFIFLLPVAAALLARRLWGERWMLITFPVFWIGFEYWHSFGDIAFPWISLGNSQASDPARVQFIAWTGIYGASLLILIVNVLFYTVWKNISTGAWTLTSRKAIATALAGILLILIPKIHGEIVLHMHPVESTLSEGSLRAGIVQPNIDPWGKWSGGEKLDQLRLYQRCTDSLARRGAELVVWPETALPYYVLLPRYQFQRFLVEEQIDSLHIALLTGFPDIEIYPDSTKANPSSRKTSVTNEWYDAYNSAVLFLPHDRRVQRYHKMLLVPFGERVPYADTFVFLNLLNWGVGISGWGVGKEMTIFQMPDSTGSKKFSTLICYESIYPGYVRQFVNSGAEFLIVITNDSWWGKTSGFLQHADYARLRAIENRRWIVRCANGGMSTYIDPYGRMYQSTGYDTQATLLQAIGISRTKTLYTRWGDYLAIPAFGISLALTVYMMGRIVIQKRKK